jgi:peptide/nickel transport system ATP-binding protein
VNEPVLSVRDLCVTLRDGMEQRNVVDSVSFEVTAGEVLALVGESGCGKTKTAEALLGLVPAPLGSVSAEFIRLNGRDLAGLPDSQMRRIRGRDLSMVFQEPLTALDPVFRAGDQLAAVFRRHRRLSRADARRASLDMLERVGFADAEHILSAYPHQLSGGMRQRVIIAMAMACRPKVLVADEPTTALDVTTQAQVLNRLTGMARDIGTAILLITHDLGIVAHYCDRALVMRGGKIVEEAAVDQLFAQPKHPYTESLLEATCGGSLP